MNATSLKKIPAPTPRSTPLALVGFMAQGMSGIAAAKIGWQLVTGPFVTGKQFATGLLLLIAPGAVAATWLVCLYGIGQHYKLI